VGGRRSWRKRNCPEFAEIDNFHCWNGRQNARLGRIGWVFEVSRLKVPIVWRLGQSHDEKIDHTIIFRLTISP
jgi:hypothetical protein